MAQISNSLSATRAGGGPPPSSARGRLHGPVGSSLRSAPAANAHSLAQARFLLTEQKGDLAGMRAAIGQIEQTLMKLNETAGDTRAQPPHVAHVLNAQAEAINSLAMIALRSLQVQTELANAVDGANRAPVAQRLPRWVGYTIAGTAAWALIATALTMLL